MKGLSGIGSIESLPVKVSYSGGTQMLEGEWMWWGEGEKKESWQIWVFPSIFPVKYETKLLADGQKHERCLKV